MHIHHHILLQSSSVRDARATWRGHLARSLGWMIFLHPLAPIASATPTSDQMRAFILQRPEQDMIHWKDPERGNSLEVRILEVSDTGVRVQKTLQSGLTDRMLPLADISSVSFARTSLEQRLINQPTADAVDALRLLWNLRSATLGMENSNVADVGIALAKALRMASGTSAFNEAEALLRNLLEKDIGEARGKTIGNELRTLELARSIEAGPPEETDRIAWEITEIDADTDAMLMATAWLGERHFEELKQLEEEHPRWQLDDEVRPIRARLYHLSLDFALYPSLFHGTNSGAASDGLLRAWHVYKHTNTPELALWILEDIATLYPGSQAAIDTADELARLRAREQAGTLVEETPDEPEPGESDEATDENERESTLPAPPQPKRYNLFDD